MDDIVIVGGGHAAATLCSSLVDAGLGARVRLVCEERHLPYQRPPLSKTYLKSGDEALQAHRPEAWFLEHGIRLHRADPAVSVDRAARTVSLRSTQVLGYGSLVFATGARARRWPGLPDGLANVATLRDAEDAQRLRTLFASAGSLTVIGGGFIGLEIAATALDLGKRVRLLEGAPRLLGRAASAQLSAHVLEAHRARGMDIVLGARVGAATVQADRVTAIEVDGRAEPVELLLVAIGAVPETALAQACGLPCDDGIVVDAQLRTEDPSVFAIGDCTRFPDARLGRPMRLESVQNANDQARTVARAIAGEATPYGALPWFWSDQGPLRLQMTGLLPAGAADDVIVVERPGPNAAGRSWLHYVDGRFCCIESVNAPMDHVMGRKLLEAGRHPAPAVVADPAVPLKSLLAG